MGARRGGNKRDFSNVPIHKRDDDAPAIDWDEINRQYVSLLTI